MDKEELETSIDDKIERIELEITEYIKKLIRELKNKK
jgi:hypothetical protein